MSDEALARADQLFVRALQIDPSLGSAAAGLAQVSNARVMLRGWAARYSVAELNETERRAREALRLDPTLGDAHTVLGAVALQRGALLEAAESYGRGIELGASYEHLAASMLVQFRLRTGRPDVAAAEMERAYQLDPFSWLPADLHGFALLHAGRPADACASLRHAETLGTAPMTRAHHAIALAKLGRTDEAIARAHAVLDPSVQRGWTAGLVAASEGLAAWGLVLAGAETQARDIARRLAGGPIPLRWTSGFPLLALGENDEACTHLADIGQVFVGSLLSLLHDFESLQRDVRCIRLLEQVGATAEFETFQRVRRGEKLE